MDQHICFQVTKKKKHICFLMLCVIPVTVINVKTNQNVLKKKYFKRKKERERECRKRTYQRRFEDARRSFGQKWVTRNHEAHLLLSSPASAFSFEPKRRTHSPRTLLNPSSLPQTRVCYIESVRDITKWFIVFFLSQNFWKLIYIDIITKLFFKKIFKFLLNCFWLPKS